MFSLCRRVEPRALAAGDAARKATWDLDCINIMVIIIAVNGIFPFLKNLFDKNKKGPLAPFKKRPHENSLSPHTETQNYPLVGPGGYSMVAGPRDAGPGLLPGVNRLLSGVDRLYTSLYIIQHSPELVSLSLAGL